MSAAAFCLFVRKTDRQNSEWFHIRVQYYTTRMLRNAAMPGPLTSSTQMHGVRKTRITVLYIFSDFTTA